MNYQVHRLAKALRVTEGTLEAALQEIGGAELTKPHAAARDWTEGERNAFARGLGAVEDLMAGQEEAHTAAKQIRNVLETDHWTWESFKGTLVGELTTRWLEPEKTVRLRVRLPAGLLKEEAAANGVGLRSYRCWLGHLLTKAIDSELEVAEVANVPHAALIPGELPMPLRVRGALESLAKERRQPVYKTAWGLMVAAAELL